MFDIRVLIDIMFGIYFGVAALIGGGGEISSGTVICLLISALFFFLAYITDNQHK